MMDPSVDPRREPRAEQRQRGREAGGRRVAERLGGAERREHGQRSALWFRLADFDPLLPKLELSWRRPVDYDLWQSTHHFMGHGN
jgi:hypothetical protein